MFTQWPLLVRLQQWLDHFELANPWTNPRWFFEDIRLITSWLAQDYLFCSPVFWVLWSIFLIYVTIRIRRNYLAYLALGRGAQPSNVRGWLTNGVYRFLLLDFFRLNVLSSPYVDPSAEPYLGQLLSLPERGRGRPRINGLGPMRQETGGNPAAVPGVTEAFRKWGLRYPETFQLALSSRTGYPTLALNVPGPRQRDTLDTVMEWGGQVAHVRPDGSLSIHLHPSDAAEVIRRGWGQRSPLAVANEVWLWRFFWHWVCATRTPLPSSEVIVYAPLDEDELTVAVHLVMAGTWWAMGCPPGWQEAEF